MTRESPSPLECDDFPGIRSRIAKVCTEGTVDESTVMGLLMRLMEVLIQENNVLLVSAPIFIVGDIHGQLDDLLSLFQQSGGITNNDDPNFQPANYLFLGDYVDRGYHGLNTFLYLVTLKLQFPNQIWLLRGNHESRQVSSRYGLYSEIILNYGHAGLWMLVNDAFDLLPVGALVDQDVFCVHGGLSPKIPLIERLSLENRQVELPASGAICDVCWSDPENVPEWRENTRGAGFLFGPEQAAKFTRINRLQFVARSHQLCQEGYAKFFGDPPEKGKHEYRLITVWSAPNYSYRSGNKATIMKFRFPGMPQDDLLVDVPSNEIRIVPAGNEQGNQTSQYFS
jgi:diadenosine tetraphosphatase ApaH/serine/threonine PP2A family protein phosphatase